MVMERYYDTHDVLHDMKSMMANSKQLDEMRRFVEGNNIDPNYQFFLLSALRSANSHKHQKEIERENFVSVDDDSDSRTESDTETDSQQKKFLNGLKEHRKTYAFDTEIDGSHVFIEYDTESETHSDDSKSEYESRRRMNHGGFEIQDQSAKDSSTMKSSPRLSRVSRGETVFPAYKPSGYLKVKGSTKSQHGHDVKVQSGRKMDIERCRLTGTRPDLLSENSRTRVNKIHREFTKQVKEEKVCSPVKSKVDKGHFSPSSKVDRDPKYEAYQRRQEKFVDGKNVMDENQCMHSYHARIGERNEVQQNRKKCDVADNNMWDRAADQGLVKGKNVIREDCGARVKTSAHIENGNLYQKGSPRNNLHMKENHCKHVDRKLKGKSVVQEFDDNLYHSLGPKNDYEDCNEVQPCKRKNEAHGHKRLIKVERSSPKTEKTPLEHGNNNVKAQPVMVKGIGTKIKNVEFDERLVGCKRKKRENVLVEEFEDVEILNGDAHLEKGIMGSFVRSKKFHKSMREDGSQDISDPSGFRARVLSVLKKPFDKAEYVRHQKAIEVGCYFDYYPDLGNKLKKYRYKKGKRLTILRGFFFWLQNLTQEGAFQPWKDRECLAVEPRSLASSSSKDDESESESESEYDGED
ncbi:hypothetical protein ABFS83_03G101300 [Erythranthe nasuta]